VKNKKHGEGRLLFPNGDVYSGKFDHDFLQGYGSMVYNDKKIYTGE